jgi:hypothetical protein
MDCAQIIARLNVGNRLPVEAIRAARADRPAVVPAFIQAIEQWSSPGGDHSMPDAIFFMFHLLGEWREKSAYRPLARLLRHPQKEIDPIFDDSGTETTHRVMAAVFDGDPQPLYDVILEPEASEFIRSRMCEALAMVTLRGEMPRGDVAQFLRECYSRIEPQDENLVWHGWQSAIALLGLAELKPLAAQAFARGFLCASWLCFEDFEGDLDAAMQNQARDHGPVDEFTLFGDTIEELSWWDTFNPQSEPTFRSGRLQSSHEPATNPFRKVGRNDPCPCGSGRKFKKCCLDARLVAPAPPAIM